MMEKTKCVISVDTWELDKKTLWITVYQNCQNGTFYKKNEKYTEVQNPKVLFVSLLGREGKICKEDVLHRNLSTQIENASINA